MDYIGPRSYDYYLDNDDVRDLHAFQRRIGAMPLPRIAGNRGDRGTYVHYANFWDLYSYKTLVLRAEKVGNDAFVEIRWFGYSTTTMYHINGFLAMLSQFCDRVFLDCETVAGRKLSAAEWRKLTGQEAA